MEIIHATSLDSRAINKALRTSDSDCLIDGCCGQRFIAAGMLDKKLTIHGIPGNALGAYLNNAHITVNANAQDAVGDTCLLYTSICFSNRPIFPGSSPIEISSVYDNPAKRSSVPA